MSIPYHKELLRTEKIRLFINFSNISHDVADESLVLSFYATNNHGEPIFTEKLNIDVVRDLYKHLDSISVVKEGKTQSSKFIETTDEISTILNKIQENDFDVILKLLQKYESNEKVEGLLESLTDLELEDLSGAFHYKIVKNEIEKLENLIQLDCEENIVDIVKKDKHLKCYSAGQPEKIFQNWIENNLWIFGIEYIKKHEARKIGMFSEGDILMESIDGYLDLIELKRPKHSLLKYDKSHNSHYPHPNLSQVVGQSLFYLQKLSEYKLNLEREYELKVIMPRIKIIVGRNKGFSEEQKDCMRMLNTNLNSIQIITYDELLEFGKLLLKTYKR